MKPDNLERRLERQPVRSVPPVWRAEILTAAENRSDPLAEQPTARWIARCCEWLWPCPEAWASVAATWLLILAINLTVGSTPGSAVRNSAPLTPQLVRAVIEERRLLTQLLSPFAADVAEPPKPPGLAPRSERQPLFLAA